MPIPPYHAFMTPLLEFLRDGKTHTSAEVFAHLPNNMSLLDKEKTEMLLSGRDTVVNTRIHWAFVYLRKAKLIETPVRGLHKITERGLKALSNGPVDISYLMQFPEFKEFYRPQRKRTHIITDGGETSTKNNVDVQEGTPQEVLEEKFLILRNQLASDLLDKVKSCSPRFFEELIVDLLVAMGYGGSRQEAGQVVGQAGDEGIDGLINEDRLGLDVVYVQAKRWTNSVGRPTIQAFVGALEGKRANKGILVTTSEFTRDGQEFVEAIGKKIILIDGEKLADLMIEYDVGVAEVQRFVVKRLDLDYFEDA